MAESPKVMEEKEEKGKNVEISLKELCDSLFQNIESFRKDSLFASQAKNVREALIYIQSLAQQFRQTFEEAIHILEKNLRPLKEAIELIDRTENINQEIRQQAIELQNILESALKDKSQSSISDAKASKPRQTIAYYSFERNQNSGNEGNDSDEEDSLKNDNSQKMDNPSSLTSSFAAQAIGFFESHLNALLKRKDNFKRKNRTAYDIICTIAITTLIVGAVVGVTALTCGVLPAAVAMAGAAAVAGHAIAGAAVVAGPAIAHAGVVTGHAIAGAAVSTKAAIATHIPLTAEIGGGVLYLAACGAALFFAKKCGENRSEDKIVSSFNSPSHSSSINE